MRIENWSQKSEGELRQINENWIQKRFWMKFELIPCGSITQHNNELKIKEWFGEIAGLIHAVNSNKLLNSNWGNSFWLNMLFSIKKVPAVKDMNMGH